MTTTTEELAGRRERLKLGGGAERLANQHKCGKLTARERVTLLLDRDSFQEAGLFATHNARFFGMSEKELPADGAVTGRGRIGGRPVHLASQDFTVAGGSAGEVHANKIADTMKASMKTGTPFVFINDSGGARVQEGVASLSGYARIFHQNVMLSGLVPQISLICGPCAGGAAYSPALTDFIIQTREGLMFITGPAVIKQVTGEIVTAHELGGVRAQMNKSGVVHFVAENDVEAIEICKRLLSFLPSNNQEDPPRGEPDESRMYEPRLNDVVPAEAKTGYDVRDVIRLVADRNDFLEVHAEFARNVVVGFGRIRGTTVGIVANQPMVLAGALDIDGSDKGAGFVRFCNAFNIPLVTFVDIPGFLPGVEQEYGGIIRHGAKLLFAYSAATVPKITVILRKAYGGGYIAMCAKDLGADCTLAWPSAEIAVMGAEAAVEIVFHRELAVAEDREGKRQELIREYRETFYTPYVAAGQRLVDDIIEPARTRGYLAEALDTLSTKRDWRPQKKHGLIPL
ncbi:MAG TPA: acyl-CoA carboxylase subunit beta [Candidatus Acidoferrales bacterium]|nr:acyl-CoA carboxylase subunit beta [Candidatus Acidoferrales bacterium]